MREIPLTRGFVAQLDDEDYAVQSQYKWHTHIGSLGSIYARRTVTISPGKRYHVWLHREIMGVRRGDKENGQRIDVDHIDHDGLNCQRDNLRVCTHQKNSHNKKKWGGESQFKGVSRHGNKWQAQFCGRYLGAYESEVTAAEVYDDTARHEAGEYAILNFPDRQPPQNIQGELHA